ncbi:ribonuclease E/G [Gracilibacillus pellucidus]|uniref:ribonuclease E/G n=1 Tax=Gracilibacillus pellucidus TaxID=3095368 RepID=UPI0029F47C49|nr:ribonuclease E/G [Gracilibacillus sp. S3-1-1]
MDIFVDRPTADARIGAIYKGKVRNVDETIEAAFIDIGLDKVGFLPKNEVPFINKDAKLASYLTDGATVFVQVIKEPYQDKGPRLTANITIPGEHLIYLPNGGYIATSKKIPENVAREWKTFLAEKLASDEGAILRTGITDSSQEEIIKDLTEARNLWQQLKSSANEQKRPHLLFSSPLIPDQMLNQYQKESFQDITFDNRSVLERMKKKYPHLANVMRQRKDANVIAGKNINNWLTDSLHPVVRKEDGIMLTVEQTEALTVIDIDSSKFTSRQNKQHTVFQINQRAVQYCIEEIRKRNISGIIVIDFLKMPKKDEVTIVDYMKKMLREDPVRTEVFGFTKLGLLEMTRKREKATLQQLLTDRAANIQPVLSMETLGYQLERELISWNSNTEALLLAIHPDLLSFIKAELIVHLKSYLYNEVYVYTDKSMTSYDIIRSGSKQLIDEYIQDNQGIVIDKIL